MSWTQLSSFLSSKTNISTRCLVDLPGVVMCPAQGVNGQFFPLTKVGQNVFIKLWDCFQGHIDVCQVSVHICQMSENICQVSGNICPVFGNICQVMVATYITILWIF